MFGCGYSPVRPDGSLSHIFTRIFNHAGLVYFVNYFFPNVVKHFLNDTLKFYWLYFQFEIKYGLIGQNVGGLEFSPNIQIITVRFYMSSIYLYAC